MKLIRELLALYPGKDVHTRKFVLAQLIDCPAEEDSPELVQVLWEELGASDPAVRRQARQSLGAFLPRHVRAQFRTVSGDGDAAAFRARARVHAASHLLLEPLARVSELAGGSSAVLASAASVLQGCLWLPSTLTRLIREVTRQGASFAAAFSLGDMRGGPAEQALRQAVRAEGRTRPDLYMVLRSAPSEETAALIAGEIEPAGPEGRVNLALALATQPPELAHPLVERLIRGKEGWVTLHALDALPGQPAAVAVRLARLACELESHELVRAHAVRAVAAQPGDEVDAFCRERLEADRRSAQCAALEALLARGHPPEALARLARPLLGSDHVRTRVHAALAVTQVEPERAEELLTPFLLGESALLRLEGAYLLGHLGGGASAALLGRIAASDPAAVVRREAVRSLALLDPGEALPALMTLVSAQDPTTLGLAAQTLAGLPADLAGAALRVLASTAGVARTPLARAALVRAAACAAGLHGLPVPDAVVAALSDPDPTVVRAALRGLKLAGDAIPLEAVRRLLDHPEPGVRAQAALTALLAGDFEPVSVISNLLEESKEELVLEVLSGLVELALVAHDASPERCGRLLAELDRHMAGPDYRAFIRGEESLTPSWEPQRPLRRTGTWAALPGGPARVKAPIVGLSAGLDRRYRETGTAVAREEALDLSGPVPLPAPPPRADSAAVPRPAALSGAPHALPPRASGASGASAKPPANASGAVTAAAPVPGTSLARVLVAVTALLLVVALGVLGARGGAGPASGPPISGGVNPVATAGPVTFFPVVAVGVRASRGGKPPEDMRAADAFTAGVALVAQPTGSAILRSAAGSALTLGGGATLACEAGRDGGVVLAQAAGPLDLDWRERSPLLLRLAAGGELEAAAVVLRLSAAGLTVRSGAATLRRGAGPPEALSSGSQVELGTQR